MGKFLWMLWVLLWGLWVATLLLLPLTPLRVVNLTIAAALLVVTPLVLMWSRE